MSVTQQTPPARRHGAGKDGAASLQAVASLTDVDRAARVAAAAGNRLRRLEREAEASFEEWVSAEAVGDQAGMPIAIHLNPGIQAALSEFKARASHAEAQRIAHEETGWHD